VRRGPLPPHFESDDLPVTAPSGRRRSPLPYRDNPYVKGVSDALLERIPLEGLTLLDELVGTIEDQGVSVAGSHYRKGREIVRLAEELGAGLIIMGGRDGGEIERAFVGIFPYFLGCFSDRVFHRARCPVLVVRGERRRENIRTHADSLADWRERI
jgi:nucleotide-binding universal stress UspA family protein